MGRIDYLDNQTAPKANNIIPAASAIIVDRKRRILLHRRTDNNLWALPGGTMEIGESITETVIREVKEETGLNVKPERMVGVYTNPKHIIAFSDGEVRQEFSICFVCKVIGGTLKQSDESSEIRYFPMIELDQLNMHVSIRQRIDDYLKQKKQAIFS